MKAVAGSLLVASPQLQDPNFARTVVLVCAAGEGGAMGVVLNRPLEMFEPADHVPDWVPLMAEPHALFRGGPVSVTGALGLALAGPSGPPPRWTEVSGEIGLIDLDEPPEPGLLQAARVFVGYAGWTEGQLEAEIDEGAWFVVRARPEDIFTEHPERLWNDVLRRQRGELSMYATYPVDPHAN